MAAYVVVFEGSDAVVSLCWGFHFDFQPFVPVFVFGGVVEIDIAGLAFVVAGDLGFEVEADLLRFFGGKANGGAHTHSIVNMYTAL